jgi:peptidoglycan pentaglycine glycine transferase (the first glycine)
MLTTLLLTEDHQQIYSEFVAAHTSGSFLQSWQWGEFQRSSGKVPVRYGVFDKSNNLIAAVQLLQTKVPRLPGTYLYAPYGPLVSSEIAEVGELISSLITKVKTDFAQAWFIRIEPKDDLPIDGKPSVHIQPGSTLLTDLSLSEEDLMGVMHQKTRYNIKVAAKHGVTVNSNLAVSKEAIELLTETSRRQGYKSHPAAYYEQLLGYFAANQNKDCNAVLYKAVHEGKCVAAAIMIDHGSTRTYLFGGSDNEQRNLMAPYALHWQAIADAKKLGMKTYDWWGAETATGATPGFVQFKMRWGGTKKFYAGTRDIVLNSKWYLAYNALRKVNRLI